MKRFAFIDYRKPSLAEKNAALRKGIELIHVGFLKASTVTPADIGPNFDGVVVDHASAAMRLCEVYDVGVFRYEYKGGVLTNDAISPSQQEIPLLEVLALDVFDRRKEENMKISAEINQVMSILDKLKELENVSTSVLSDSSDPGPWHIYMGKPIAIRTATIYYVGKLVKVYPQELLLQDASWIPDTGKWEKFLKTGVITECQPFPDGSVIVGRGAIIDACRWR